MALKEKILMSCEGATALIEKKRDQKLGLAERIGLWVHLGYCSFCALFFEQSRVLDESARSYSEKISSEQKSYQLNPGLKAELKKSFDLELNKQRT